MKHIKEYLSKIIRKSHTPPPRGFVRMGQSEKIDGFRNSVMDTLLCDINSRDITEYPDTTRLRRIIAKKHGVSEDNILLTNGSDNAIRLIFHTFVKNFAITSEFYFPMYDVYAKMFNARLVTVPYVNENTLTARLDEFDKAVDVIVLANPNSPVGEYYQKHHIAKLLEFGTPTLIDEAYVDFVEDADDLVSLIAEYDNLMLTRTLSKGYGGAGLRLGYIIASAETIQTLSACADPYPISGITAKMAETMLTNPYIARDISSYHNMVNMQRETLCYLLGEHDIDYRSSHGNWIHVEQTEVLTTFFKNSKIDVKYDCQYPNSPKRWIRMSMGYFKLDKLLEDFLNES